MKRFLSMLLCIMILTGILPAASLAEFPDVSGEFLYLFLPSPAEGGSIYVEVNGKPANPSGCQYLLPGGATVTASPLAKSGYAFVGWYWTNTRADIDRFGIDGSGNYSSFDSEGLDLLMLSQEPVYSFTVPSSVVMTFALIAVFRRTYSVKVVTDGNGTALASPQSGVPGTEVTLTAAPKDGYQFREWQVLSGGITIVNNHFTIGTADVSVKAVFDPVPAAPSHKLTINYLKENGSQIAKPYVSMFAEGEFFIVASPKVSGYQPDHTAVSGIMGTEDIIINVIYSHGLLTVFFHPNGAAQKTYGQHVKYNTKKALKKNAFTRKGYYFDGWNTKPGGNGKTYKDQQVVKIKKSLNLYAQWGKLNLKVKKYTYSKAAKKQIKVTVTNKKGKRIRSLVVTFLVDGKTYKAKTNSQGVASVFVKINKKGKYPYTVSAVYKGVKFTKKSVILVK